MADPIPPAPGAVKPSELYVDLQSRTLWLGVTEAVDPARAVLISDIEGVDEDLAATLASANAYTNGQVATRAPIVHTHTASQITDFNAAVDMRIDANQSIQFVRKMIMMWSGLLSEIGVGPLAGWALCDGGNGTPNLRDKFILGAGNKAVGAVNPAASLTTTGGGTHTHTINGTALTVAHLPVHNHGGITSTQTANHTHTQQGNTGSAGTHAHTVPAAGDSGSVTGANRDTTVSGANTIATSSAGAHVHPLSGQTSIESANHAHTIPNQGGGATHTHTIVGGGGTHEHNVSSAQLRDTIPYYALAFIMKL